MTRRCRECLDTVVVIKSDRGSCRNNRCSKYWMDRPLSDFEKVLVRREIIHNHSVEHRISQELERALLRKEQVGGPSDMLLSPSTSARESVVERSEPPPTLERSSRLPKIPETKLYRKLEDPSLPQRLKVQALGVMTVVGLFLILLSLSIKLAFARNN